jgi:hypothetical protein
VSDEPQTTGTTPCPHCGVTAIAFIDGLTIRIVCDHCLYETWGDMLGHYFTPREEPTDA